MRTQLLSACAVCCAAVSGVAVAADMQPGQWEITTKMSMAGMPMDMPAQTLRHCYRAEDVKDPRKTVPQDKDCKADSVSVSGNTVSWRVSCRIEGETLSGQGSATLGAQSYQGKALLSGKVDGTPMQMNVTYAGKRLGECK